MRHPSLTSDDVDWPSLRLAIYSQDDAFRFMARSALRKLDAGGVLSTSVGADMATFCGERPHLVLVDLSGDAEAALRVLAGLRSPAASPVPDVPVLMVARGGDRDHLPRALALGIEGVLPKPVSGHELMVRVAATLRSPQRLAAPSHPAAPIPPPAAAQPAGAGDAVRAEIRRLAGRLGAGASGRPLGPGGGVSRGGVWGGGVYGAPEAAAATTAGRLADDDLAAEDPPPSSGARPKGPGGFEPPSSSGVRPKGAGGPQDWLDALEVAGRRKRAGADVGGLDVSAILAQHGEWLQTQGAAGRRANFEGMDLAGVDMAGAVLAGAGLRRADLSDARLAEARLDGADLRYAVLAAADCGAAVLAVAQLRHADLSLANLEGASLRGADLSGARFRGARFDGADFDGAMLVETDLREADLSRAENLRQAQLDKAVADSTTRLPPGLRLPRRKD